MYRFDILQTKTRTAYETGIFGIPDTYDGVSFFSFGSQKYFNKENTFAYRM